MILPIICLVILFGVILFQVMLVLGAPWGEYTIGGKYPGKLPKSIKALVLIQILVLIGFGYIIAEFTGLIQQEPKIFGNIGIWFVFAFFVLGTLLNWITPSKKERMVWGPVNSIFLIILSLILFT